MWQPRVADGMSMNKSSINVLIVDDDKAVGEALREIVKRLGFQTTLVHSAPEALNVVKIKPVHLAIIDCMLPKVNGVELAKELRSTRFQKSPILFISGIFRDKGFAADAIQKTGALDFLFKPIDAKALKGAINKAVEPLVKEIKVPLHALLTKPYSSSRDRLKVIEELDEISGYDLAAVVSILLDAKVDGHINISSSEGELYGIGLENGAITQLDSDRSESLIGEILVGGGFLSETEFQEFSKQHKKGDLVASLVNEAMLSPHALGLVKKEQIKREIRSLFGLSEININFSPEDRKDRPHVLNLQDFSSILHDEIKKIPEAYLQEFYKSWLNHPLRLVANLEKNREMLNKDLFSELSQFVSQLSEEKTILELREQFSDRVPQILRAVHFMALMRLIVIDDKARGAAVQHNLEELKRALAQLKGKTPFEVFEYFGVGGQAKDTEISRVYKEFAKSNHPDHLQPDASPELRKALTDLFAIVSEAYSVLMDPVKKEKMLETLKERELKQQVLAESLLDEGIKLLGQNQFERAEKAFSESQKNFPSKEAKIYFIWARLKNPKLPPSKEELRDLSESLYEIPAQERRTHIFYLVAGLIKKAQGDVNGAITQLNKAQQFEPNSLDVKRELVALSGKKRGGEITGVHDLLKGDLSQIVGSLFGRKK